MTKQEALSILQELEHLTDEFGGPYSRPRERVQKLLLQLEGAGLANNYFSEKLAYFREAAEIGFSTRKHEKYPGGISQLKSAAIGYCWTMRGIVEKSNLPESEKHA